MDIIIPCAGNSTRFPNARPKYLLAAYDGQLMIEKVVKSLVFHKSLDWLGNIYITILKEHDDKYGVVRGLTEIFDTLFLPVSYCVLDQPTKGPAETVFKTIMKSINHVDYDNTLLVRDCDSFFEIDDIEDGNIIYTQKLSKLKNTRTAGAKSYVVSSFQNVVTSIIEKEIISDDFCVGGYQFKTTRDFISAFQDVEDQGGELFVSSVIEQMMANDNVFIRRHVTGYHDVGTIDDWVEYNDRPTIFCDIDGVLIKNQSRFSNDGFSIDDTPVPLEYNVKALLDYQKQGAQIIFTTSRSREMNGKLSVMLANMGFKGFMLLCGLNRSKRILINDYNATVPYPAAVAINLRQDTDYLNIQLPPKE